MKSYTHFTLSERNCLQQFCQKEKEYEKLEG